MKTKDMLKMRYTERDRETLRILSPSPGMPTVYENRYFWAVELSNGTEQWLLGGPLLYLMKQKSRAEEKVRQQVACGRQARLVKVLVTIQTEDERLSARYLQG